MAVPVKRSTARDLITNKLGKGALFAAPDRICVVVADAAIEYAEGKLSTINGRNRSGHLMGFTP